MEEVHGVDVSWLHHPNPDKDKERQKDKGKAQHGHGHRRQASAAPVLSREARLPEGANVKAAQKKQDGTNGAPLSKLPSPPNVTPPTAVQPSKDTTQAVPSTPSPAGNANGKAPPKRPNLSGRQSSEKVGEDGRSSSRRQSWMNSISSKFSSSQTTPQRPSLTPTQSASKIVNGAPSTTTSAASPEEAVEVVEPYTPPPKQKDSSFFSSLTRRLSAASQSSGLPRVQNSGSICARKVLNVDPNRERCLVPEMDSNKLRKVSFCVDVEIAGGPRYEEDDDDEARDQKKKDFKMKERAEGEALKNPETLKEEKDDQGEPKLESRAKAMAIPGKQNTEKVPHENLEPKTSLDDEATSRKREKKKKSEEERKERKENRRRRAEESGSIPVELSLDGDSEDTKAGSSPSSTPNTSNLEVAPQQTQATPKRQDRPTTDPARVYRRCCQLRETPILKRITEQLMKSESTLPAQHGVVNMLDLSGSRLQLADVVSLGDWLAVVPVKHLRLEDADLNDEGVRYILAGLLAAKIPEPSRRKSLTPKHREGVQADAHRERAGIIEKITFKNNPRITRVGWKHISLFLYMCRSLKAIDVSMNQFPDTLPPSTQNTPARGSPPASTGNGEDIDAAETLYKCLSGRPAGSRLEELIMSECALTAPQIRKVVDGAMVSGVRRLGLAGNNLDDEGLEHIIHYVRSNVCQALDIGGNDLRGKLGNIAEALGFKAPELSFWGLSLAGCNLDSRSLKPLFAMLEQLPDFRFIDLSNNRDLCSVDNGFVSLLRHYISRMKSLKRLHLKNVGMSSRQAIALADALAEGPRLAHIDLLENPTLTALAHAKTEEDHEEACALYASVLAAVRVSSTLICIDIDVPSPDSSELVKAIAKQVVAYSLRNMEKFAIAEATGMTTANATAALTGPHGGEENVKDISVPEVLWQLVGRVEESSEDHDNDPPAPDEDYIVGGTGVVKALQYVLGEKANDGGRASFSQTPRSGTVTPTQRPDSSAGYTAEQKGKAKKMSKNLLDSARKIRHRLQPALVKEAATGDEMAYRRLLFLDQTLQSMIERFEEEYPECRIAPRATEGAASENSSLIDTSNNLSSVKPQGREHANASDDEDFLDAEDGESHIRPAISRHNSDVSLASRRRTLEEGQIHRLGMHLRREIIDSGADSPRSPAKTGAPSEFSAPTEPGNAATDPTIADTERIRRLGKRIEGISGIDLKHALEQSEGWETTLTSLGANYEDLRRLQELDPEGWETFKEAQEKARVNMGGSRPGSVGGDGVPPPPPPKD